MAVYAIGDVQGCYDELRRLIDVLQFDPAVDQLWLVGDLVNRGPKSLEVLRFLSALGSAAHCVLGNHDLHLLALSQGNLKHYDDEGLDAVLRAADRDELLYWLRHRPLLHRDEELGFSMVHAGLPPQWDIVAARARAAELETILQGAGFAEFCHNMYGNEPSLWDDELQGWERLRFITNCFTRLRYCDASGRLVLDAKGAPARTGGGLIPWFRVQRRSSIGERIVFGHWSTLGFHAENQTYALDSGCIWGGQLSALRLDSIDNPVHVDCTRDAARVSTDT